MAKTEEQYEKDIASVINYLKKTDPKNATREKAIEMLGDMQALAHLIAHKVVEDENKQVIKEKKLTIRINKPAEEVFQFALNPENTPLWVDSIVKEETNEYPTKLGTVYRNVNKAGTWSEYTVTEFAVNRVFVLTMQDQNYNVRYTLKPINDSSTELEYYEWVEHGSLDEPFTMEILEKLKQIIENS